MTRLRPNWPNITATVITAILIATFGIHIIDSL